MYLILDLVVNRNQMKNIKFEDLPEAISGLQETLERIESLLTSSSIRDDFQSPTFFNIEQASKYLTLSKNTIYGLVQRMQIPYSKKGKRLYFSKRELIDWVKSGRKLTHDEILNSGINYFIPKAKRGRNEHS